jgi:hypothetical protein
MRSIASLVKDVFNQSRQEDSEMKRFSFLLLAITLTFVAACQPAENKNSNASANSNAHANANQNITTTISVADKSVQIFVYDDPANPGSYLIDDPGSVILHKKKNQKISWCVVYDGATTPDEVVVDNFRTPPPPATPTARNPFGDGSDPDNTFTIASGDFGTCKKGTKSPKATADLGTYKYTITVKKGGVPKGQLDPGVIITD